ncbi:MAG: AsmA-like C-terminal region-containing protein [Hyphomicrobiaceae bacterium]
MPRKKVRGGRGLFGALVGRPLGILLRVVAMLLPLLLLAAGLLYVRLSYNPVSVAFLAGPIERALNAELPGFSFGIGGAVLQRSETGGIEFRLKAVRMNDSAGGVVALARFASVELDSQALLSARIAPSRIDLIEPRFLVFFDERGKLSLKSPAPEEGHPGTVGTPRDTAAMPQRSPASGPTTPSAPGTAPDSPPLDVARLLVEALARMRRDGQTVSYLKDFGFKNATLIIDEAGRQTVWRIPEVDIDLQHKQKRSIVVGRAQIAASGEPWTLRFRAEDSEKSRSIIIATEFENLVPRSLGQQIPALGLLEPLDAPASGKMTFELNPEGRLTAAQANIALGRGALAAPWPGGPSVGLTEGRIELRYDGATNAIDVLPSPVVLSAGTLTLTGRIAPAPAARAADSGWRFEFAARDGALSPATPGAKPVPIDVFVATGQHSTATGRSTLERLVLKAGGAEIEMASAAPDPASPTRSDIDGRISPLSIATLLSVWPAELAPRTRSYLARNVRKGAIRSGTFRLGGADPASPRERRMSLAIEAHDIELELLKGLPALEAPRALVRVEGTSIEVTIPDATLAAAPSKRLTVKGARYTAVGIDGPRPLAEVAGRIQGPLATALEVLDREPLRALRGQGLAAPPGIDGKVDAQIRAAFPVGEGIDVAEVRIDGRVRITDGRLKNVVGNHDVTGATIAIDATDKHVDVKGEMLLAGVVAKLQGRLNVGPQETKSDARATDPKLPVAKLTLRLDDADRAQLGLDLDRLVRGDVPVEILFFRTPGEAVRTRVAADLTAADVMLEELQWTKPSGRPAKLEFDVGRDQAAKGLELQNFKLDGENIAVDGWVALGADGRARAFYFPEFLLNVISNMEVQGTLRADRVWEVKARGKTPFDAGNIFRAMFALDKTPPKPSSKERPGLDLTAEFDTVLGLNEQRLRQVRLLAKKRNDVLTEVDFRSVLESGRPLTGILRTEPGKPRILRVETGDAGQALKLIGFYKNMVGGTGTLNLNLDGSGAVETQGTAVIRSFRVLGDTIAAELFQTPDDSQPAIAQARPGRRVLREQFDFEQLQANVSVGNGQLIINDSLAKGPLIGASLRGKLDFRSRRLDLGGTYVPLSGLNRALSGVPVLSELLTGPRGEGLLGITFAINGPMADPNVIVNPFSPLTPGILRELMQMSPDNPTITPRAEPRKALPKGAGPQTRASPPTAAPDIITTPRVAPEVIDGWSTEAKGAPRKK